MYTFQPGKSNQPLRLMNIDDMDDDTGAGLRVEDDRNDHPEVEIQEDDQEGSTENNDIINDDQQHRYNLRSRKVNLTTINNGQLKTFPNNLKNEKSVTPILKFIKLYHS